MSPHPELEPELEDELDAGARREPGENPSEQGLPEGEEPDRAGENPPSIRPTDRVCTIGMTGSGKSTLLAALFAEYAGQRLLVDVNDAYELEPAATAEEAGGACVAERVRDIDWRQRTIRFVPRAQSERVYDDLYAAIFDRGRMMVWLDEGYGPTTANRAPRWLRTVVTQGRKRGILHGTATQEPMNVLPVLYSQAEHLMLFRLSGRPDELRALSPRLGLTVDELAAELATLPEFGYLRASTRSSLVYRMPPLPPELLERARAVVSEA